MTPNEKIIQILLKHEGNLSDGYEYYIPEKFDGWDINEHEENEIKEDFLDHIAYEILRVFSE